MISPSNPVRIIIADGQFMNIESFRNEFIQYF